jgi:HAD superfamily hydrolase (TIGR01484 family)
MASTAALSYLPFLADAAAATVNNCSCCSAAGHWRFIDLLPQHAGKGTAMQHIMQHYGFDASSTVAVGDSANDLLMLKQVGLHV